MGIGVDRQAAVPEVADALAALWLAIGGAGSTGTTIAVAAESLPEPDFKLTPAAVEEAILAAPDLRALHLRVKVEEASVSAAGAGRFGSGRLRVSGDCDRGRRFGGEPVS